MQAGPAAVMGLLSGKLRADKVLQCQRSIGSVKSM